MNEAISDIDESEYSSQHSEDEFKNEGTSFKREIRASVNLHDASVFADVYNKNYSSAYFLARKFIKSDYARDIVASVFSKLWSMKKTFADLKHVEKTIHVAVKNACLSHIQQEQRRLRKESGWQYSLNLNSERDELYEEIGAEKLKLIYATIEDLPKACKRTFKMAYFDNLRNHEIANLLGLSVYTVINQKKHAIKVIRMALLTTLGLLLYLFHSKQ